MSASPEDRARLAAAVDKAYCAVFDGQGAPGRRIYSLHTSAQAANAMVTTIERSTGRRFAWCAIESLRKDYLGELDQLVTAIKDESELLAMPAEQLANIDSFTVHEASVFGLTDTPAGQSIAGPPAGGPASFDVNQAAGIASALFVNHLKLPVMGVASDDSTAAFAAECCKAGEIMAKACASHFMTPR